MTDAWQSYDSRGKGHGKGNNPVVPEPGAYGAGLLLAVFVVLRLTKSRWRGPAD